MDGFIALTEIHHINNKILYAKSLRLWQMQLKSRAIKDRVVQVCFALEIANPNGIGNQSIELEKLQLVM